MPQMWASAQAADTQTAWQQVNAWRRTHDLLLHHAGRLKACADELSYAWPPGRSPAAQAFIEHITQLRTAILQASIDAATNYSAIAGVLTSLSAARSDMAKLMEEWEAYENSGTGEQARRALSGGPDSPEALNARAQSRMSQNDQEVLEASRRLVDLTAPWEQPESDRERVGASSANSRGTGSSRSPRDLEDLLTSRMVAPSVSGVDASDGQPGLAGSTATTPTEVAGSLAPGSQSSTSPTLPPRGSEAGFGTVGRPISAVSSSGDPARPGRPLSSHAGRSQFVGGTTPVPALPTGAGRAQGKVNPVGGVIESSRPVSSAAPLPLLGGARGSVESRGDSSPALTMHWEVSEGVAPVIEPPPEQPFELGPGVIGIDR